MLPTIRQLHYLKLLAEHGGFGRAAEAAGDCAHCGKTSRLGLPHRDYEITCRQCRVNLDDIVNRVVTAAQPLADQRHVRVMVEHPDDPVRAEVDSRRVERILRNLVTNAIQAMPKGGTLSIRSMIARFGNDLADLIEHSLNHFGSHDDSFENFIRFAPLTK